MKGSSGKGISWKTKKRMAEVLCAVVVVSSMTLSLYFQAVNNWNTKKDISSVQHSAQTKVVNYGNSATLTMNTSTVESASRQDTYTKEQSNDIKKNRVVHNMLSAGTGAPNQVVKNAPAFTLVTGSLENYGTEPDWGEADMLYQYPVELGYPIDKNYDGRQTGKGTIQDYIFEPAPEDWEDLPEESVAEEKSDDDSEDGTQDDENEKILQKIHNELQKKIWSIMFPTEPVPVDMPVENVKKAVDVAKINMPAPLFNFTKGIQVGANILLSGVSVGDDTEVGTESPVTGEDAGSDTEEPVGGEPVESDTEAPVDEGPAESDTEAPVDEDNTEGSTEASDAEEPVESDTETSIDEGSGIEADSSFFTISGEMRAGSQVFVSDITVKPTGKDGFNMVRLGKEGDFQSFVTLTEDASEKEVTLYFSDGTNETTGVTFAYSKDTSNPSMALNGISFNTLRNGSTSIYCTNNAELDMILEDGGTGVDKICYVYGDRVTDFTNIAGGAKAALPQDFYGKIFMNCADKAGNTSSILSEYILLDRATPTIAISQDEFCTTPYTLWIDVADNGSIVSGLADVVCTVNGESVEITNLETKGVVTLEDNLEVPQRVGFSIPFEGEGEFTIQVSATDYAGNTTVVERSITVTKPEFVSVFMPDTFTIHIDPQRLLEREQIFSDNIELTNVSEFDVKVTVDSIELYVNDETSSEGIEKDCEIYFVTPDTGERIKLEKGENKDVYSYCLPVNATGDIANLCFVGSTTEGSDKMWQDSDISIVVKLSFRKWK